MITKTISVTQHVEVSIDESRLTPEWLASFREMFYDFHDVDDHLKHLAQLEARGLTYQPQVNNEFIEGYGYANDMGIEMRVQREMEVEIEG